MQKERVRVYQAILIAKVVSPLAAVRGAAGSFWNRLRRVYTHIIPQGPKGQ